jgi:thiol-disulfide isomerase/thioredoxin
MKGTALLLFAVLPTTAFAGPPAPGFVGTWRATLTLPGGELPFTLRVDEKSGGLSAVAINGEEEARFDLVRSEGTSLLLRFEVYDSEIRAGLSSDGARLAGEWTKPVGVRLPFYAVRGDARRFLPGADPQKKDAPSVAGAWIVTFKGKSGDETARGEFTQVGERVRGTFLTPTGDHRYLEGDFREDVLRLSGFDGGHAFLYSARRQADGSLAGDFWSGSGASTTSWTARPVPLSGREGLPDAFAEAGLANPEGRLRFRFPDLEGRPVSLSDPRFAGKVVIVNIFGSWCPNCNDEAPLLSQWYRRHKDRGFEIVGLAYEATGDRETDTKSVRTFARHYGVEYPLLLAGIRERAAAAKTLPDVTGLFAFPSTIFVGRDGRVRTIHSGYAGPGTGAHHQEMVSELDALLEGLLAEPAPKAEAASPSR